MWKVNSFNTVAGEDSSFSSMWLPRAVMCKKKKKKKKVLCGKLLCKDT